MLWMLTPEKKRNLARFSAPNPWAGGATANWSFDKCFDGGPAPAYAALDSNEDSLPHRFALRAEGEKEYRALPDSLAALWLKGSLPSESLPALLHSLEPRLIRSDYIRLSTMNPIQRGIRTWAAPVFGVFLLVLAISMFTSGESSTGLVMLLIAALAIGAPLALFSKFNARRREQQEWALSTATAKRAGA